MVSYTTCAFALVALFALVTISLVSVVGALEFRLDKKVVPSLYNITIKPYFLDDDAERRFTFDGDVTITLKAVEEKVKNITLHKDFIDIKNAWLYNAEGNLQQTIGIEQLEYESETDKLTVSLEQELDVNVEYQLRFIYIGQIRDGMAGFFHANYTDPTGDTKWLGVTQMQRIDARSVFPCFDEPAFKAKFQLHINRPKNYNALSNTRLINSVADGVDRYLDHFEVTPIMSTYLVTFIVSEYESRGNVDYAVISRPEYYNYTEFSYNVGLRTIEAFNELFKQPYTELGNSILQYASSPKFPHNGMENWGLIIYSEQVLVHLPGYTDGWSNKELTVRILAHETSHMWFGDSVTFSWWSYFWLNEGFARYYEYFLANEIYPEYQLDQQFIVNQLQLIFSIDAVSTTQPLSSPESSISTPTEIASKFSSIAYCKGATILRMIKNSMGATNFDKAISMYLKENHLKSVEPVNLFDHLKQHWPANQDVDLEQFFHDWTEQVGFPMVIVNASVDLMNVTLTQRRFLLNSTDGSDVTLNYTIPITFATNLQPDFKNLTPSFYYKKSEVHKTLKFDAAIEWIVLNKLQSNYHRVYYDEPLLRRLQAALTMPEHSGIPVENRAQIVDDLFSFARAELLDYAEVIQFMEYLSEETEYLPWYAAYAGLQRIAPRLTVEQLPDFAKYLSDITQKVYAKLGFKSENDTVLEIYNRNKLISWLCKYGHDDCNRQANIAVTDIMSGVDMEPIPDFRRSLYCSASRAGSYRIISNWYGHEDVESERELLWQAISCTKEFKTHYETAILDDETPEERKISGISQLYTENPENVSPIFILLTEDITRLATALKSWENVADVISDIADYFTTQEQLQLLEEFIVEKGQLFGSSLSILEQSVKTVKSNLEMSGKRLGRMVAYLKQRNGTSMLVPTMLTILLSFIYTCLT